MDEKDIYLILFLFVLMIHLMITALTFVDDDEYHKYHDFSGIQGIIIVILRLLLFTAYSYGFYSTLNESTKKKHMIEAKSGFSMWNSPFIKGRVIEGIYILAYPLLWVLSVFVTPYARRRFITFTDFAVQIGTIYYLLIQFSEKGTSYYKASEKSATILPSTKFD